MARKLFDFVVEEAANELIEAFVRKPIVYEPGESEFVDQRAPDVKREIGGLVVDWYANRPTRRPVAKKVKRALKAARAQGRIPRKSR
jgi:hypothetical protein